MCGIPAFFDPGLTALRGTRVPVGLESAACCSTEPLRRTLGVEHVMAPGALPPAFSALRIDGEPCWNGGQYANTPIGAVLDDRPRRDALSFAVSLWHQTTPEPESIWPVTGRQKAIQHPSRATATSPARSRSTGCAT